jgi:hypothetical protein
LNRVNPRNREIAPLSLSGQATKQSALRIRPNLKASRSIGPRLGVLSLGLKTPTLPAVAIASIAMSKLLFLLIRFAILYVLLMRALHAGWKFWVFGLNRASQEIVAGEQRYALIEARNKQGSLIGWWLRRPIPPGWHFALRPEGRFDRLAKFLRIIDEPQAGDDEFDAHWFIDLDAPCSLRLFNTDERLRQRLSALALRARSAEMRLRRLECGNGMLDVFFDGRAANSRRLIDHTVSWLAPVVDRLFEAPPPIGKPTRDRSALMSQIALTAMVGTAIALFAVEYRDPHVNTDALWKWALGASAVAWLLLQSLTALVCRRSLKRHRALALGALFWLLPAAALGFHAARLFNLHGPQATPIATPARLADWADWSRGLLPPGQRVAETLVVLDPDGANDYVSADVDRATLQQWIAQLPRVTSDAADQSIADSPRITVGVYAGAFGVPWVGVMPIEGAKR